MDGEGEIQGVIKRNPFYMHRHVHGDHGLVVWFYTTTVHMHALYTARVCRMEKEARPASGQDNVMNLRRLPTRMDGWIALPCLRRS